MKEQLVAALKESIRRREALIRLSIEDASYLEKMQEIRAWEAEHLKPLMVGRSA